MRDFLIFLSAILLVTGVYGYMSNTVPVQAGSQQVQSCDGLDVGEVDHSTSVEDRTLNFDGLFCAPNIGYTLEEISISVDGEKVTAYADISAPEGISGPAVTPVRFNESRELPPENYDLQVRVEVEGHRNISDTSDLTIEGESRGLMQRLRTFFANLF